METRTVQWYIQGKLNSEGGGDQSGTWVTLSQSDAVGSQLAGFKMSSMAHAFDEYQLLEISQTRKTTPL